ncbi:DUF6122 family protein [Maribacter hydrothermalis]|uniref:LexA-binding, inner membrane-associated hydrolase n=1 Tax=Maribacter hydrothermalis TaxID=1836467 RepID=A0A1B7ZDC8_9FLAO|nr:DUF6122 family protein [Maribacter hydrothermalis]APQ18452.1 hypothetical protein BTR34_14505 [Maribacter hydrothermalis]OBR41341.1 hypothetical protein A9200_13590 [Maribacter hydrothermalis]
MIRFIAHYGIHFIVPILIAFYFYKDNKFWVAIILLLGILIDVDHILANPMFDPDRCSINFHPLHSYWAIGAYTILFTFKKTRIIGLALLIHILADTVDCLFIRSVF